MTCGTLTFSQKTTTAGFEPTLPEGNCLAGNRLNHSATLSCILLCKYVCDLWDSSSVSFRKMKTTVAGFEPTHPEDNWFQVNRLRPLGHTVLLLYFMRPPCPSRLCSLLFFFTLCSFMFLFSFVFSFMYSLCFLRLLSCLLYVFYFFVPLLACCCLCWLP